MCLKSSVTRFCRIVDQINSTKIIKPSPSNWMLYQLRFFLKLQKLSKQPFSHSNIICKTRIISKLKVWWEWCYHETICFVGLRVCCNHYSTVQKYFLLKNQWYLAQYFIVSCCCFWELWKQVQKQPIAIFDYCPPPYNTSKPLLCYLNTIAGLSDSQRTIKPGLVI